MERRFPARWDRSLTISTALLLALLAAVAGFTARAMIQARAPGPLGGLVPVLLGTLVAVVWALAPRAFVLGPRELRVERNLGPPVRVPLAEIRTAGLLPPGALRGALKVAGTAGLFGHYGRFRSRALGGFRLYATRREGLVAVRTAADTFVLSPEPAGGFAEALLAAAPGARALPAQGLAPAAGGGRGALWIAVAIAAVVPLAVGGVAWWAWSRAPRAIGLGEGAVVIERNAASPVEIPLVEVRAAEPLPAERLAGLRRVAGTAGFGVQYGAFWSPSLGRFQLWAIGGRRAYVLLEAASGPIVLTPDDPEGFLAGLERR